MKSNETMEVALSNGGSTIVDALDYEAVSRWKWKRHIGGYACRSSYENGKSSMVLLHRFINQTPAGMETDHINGNKLDNRRANLRTVGRVENELNKPMPRTNTSGFKGVTWDKKKGKWSAKTRRDGKDVFLGRYDSPEEAAAAYRKFYDSI